MSTWPVRDPRPPSLPVSVIIPAYDAEGLLMPVDVSITCKHLQISTVRKIEYSIIHPSTPVFHIRSTELQQICGDRPVLFVIDQKLTERFSESVRIYADKHLGNTSIFSMSCEENEKNLSSLEYVVGQATARAFPRHGIMVGVGGGCLLDTVGLAASLYRRGVDYLRIPTTLLGMVDVAVGIKHGVNYLNKKNLLGSFYPALGAINDIHFLETLSARDFACGFAEMLKIAAVKDKDLFRSLEQSAGSFPNAYHAIEQEALESMIIRSEQAMIGDLESNLFEENLQRLSDFGHTFSPELEIESAASIAHGEAVALDMICSAAIAASLELCQESYLDRFIFACDAAGLPVWHPLCETALLERSIVSQRAHRGGNLNLVLPVDPGHGMFVQDVAGGVINMALALMHQRTQRIAGSSRP